MTRLKVQDLSILVHLGCLPEERRVPQEVRVSFEIRFREAPPACATDHVSDTVCYAKLCEAVRECTLNREYQTVEHLGAAIAQSVQPLLSPSESTTVDATVSVHKVRPPVEGLLGGVVFEQEL